MKTCALSSVLWIIIPLFFLFTSKAHSDISINSGSAGTSAAPNGQTWLGDFHPNLTLKGASTRSSVILNTIISAADEIPYKTARISRSQFSYVFRLDPGQKFIRLHFNPASYNGFETFKDLFGVEAGSFTLLSNFSASITSTALAVNSFTKEYCLSVDENEPLNITFSAGQLQDAYAFVNGIEIVSVPESVEYCHTGDVGVQVVGQKSLVYVDKSTALEMVHRRNVEWDPGLRRGDDLQGIWAAVSREKANRGDNVTWKVSVDVGFRYLVRLYFSELGRNTGFSILIDHNIACTNAELLKERDDMGSLRYKNYMVMANGRKQDGKRDILISLQSRDKFVYVHRPLEGFEVFKLSNHDNSLASPNPLPSTRDPPSRTMRSLLSVIDHRNAIASVVIMIICLINILFHMLRQYLGDNFTEVDDKPSPKDLRYCRRFSLAEVQLAARNFDSAYLIGKGGFGKVYKGLINNGEDTVAIKRLKLDSKQGKREFLAEIETLSELRHVNLVSLIGYCNEQREMILVYECMPNGSLADHIYKLARKNNSCCSLSWEQRLSICIGAGRGLDYLHTGHGIIHRDVKASNILLDENFVAKVSDFGLVKTLNLKELQSQVSTNPKGTFGYFDPDYFSTRSLTKKSDTYSFGVMLLEVLCGRPAVDPWVEEDKRSLTMWARDNISRGEVEQIIAPCLRGKISPDSLKAFVGIVERCLLNEPKKRPTIAHVVINLEFALEQQKLKTSVSNEIARVTDVLPRSYKLTSGADVLPYADEAQMDNARSLVPNMIASGTGLLQNIGKSEQENANFLLPSDRTGGADVLPYTDGTTLSLSTRHLTPVSSNAQNVTSILKKPTNSRMANAEPSSGEKDGRKTIMHKISRLLPWNTTSKREKSSKRILFYYQKKEKSSKRKASMGTSLSAPLSHLTSNKTSLGGITFPQNRKLPEVDGNHDWASNFNLRIFSLSELKAATKNFRADTVIGQGGFGKVYKGRLQDKSTKRNASVSEIAVKRLTPESVQGFKEWMAELNFLGKLSHPNLVKILGYCWEDRELLLVYEYMQKGSLDNHIFGKFSTIQPLPWNIRLKILTGAARGLAYLHSQEVKIIYRDFKASNILLDESYQAKLADFGLAKSGPNGDRTHVSTQVMGTHGYAAPEYIATGHLYVKSDVYSFGVFLAEMLTGRRAFDRNCPSDQQNLVEWIKPRLSARKKFMDPRLEGNCASKSALQILQLARNCLENNPKARPEMKEVVEVLERLDSADDKPGEPRVRFDNPVANALPQ